MVTRRQFLKIGATGGTLLLVSQVGRATRVRAAPIPGGTLAPGGIPKFVTQLLIPPAMPAVATDGGFDYYEIAVRQHSQQILPAGMPTTKVWGYGTDAPGGIYNAPSLTIEATHGRPVRVKWINDLKDANGNFLPHLLPVDQTLHWANPPGGTAGRDTRPAFDATPAPYTGPVPIVTHVHGAVGVGDESDGYAEAWFLPDANDIPSGYAREGTWYDFFAGKAQQKFGTAWGPGYATFQYPNSQRASTIWYHDHTLGMTRLNVYAGPAGFYLIRGGDDDVVIDTRSGLPGVLPGPAPQRGDPNGKTYYEVPLAIQDRAFNSDGTLFYPNTRAFFDGFAGPYIPTSDVSPIWNPEFFGNCMIVNGNTWPFLNVEPRRYRLRLLNGCQSRFLKLSFSDSKVEVWQIGSEGGFLRAPVRITELLMAPAERADVIVDFSRVKLGKSVILNNRGPDAPFGGGGFRPADPQSTGLVMQFNVSVPLAGADPSTPPAFLQLPPIAPLAAAGVTRKLALLERMAMTPGVPPIPVEALLGRIDQSGQPITLPGHNHPGDMWMDPVTENPDVGAVEVWEIYNLTVDAHPIHIHDVFFEVVDRQLLDKKTNLPIRAPRPPTPTENGWKDTVIAYPGEVTRVRAKFDNAGQFVWHCHIVEHEDNEMMRPFRVGPEQDGQPGAMAAAIRRFAVSAGGGNPFLCELT